MLDAAQMYAPGAAADLGALVSVRREASLLRTVSRVRTSLARLVALRCEPHVDWGVALADVWSEVMGAFCDPAWVDERDKLISRTRERYMLEEVLPLEPRARAPDPNDTEPAPWHMDLAG